MMDYSRNEFIKEFDRVNSQVNELYHEIAVKQGLSDSAYSVLQAISALDEGCTQTDVYRYCGLNKQTVNSSVKKLKNDGLLAFRAGNGRETRLYFTEKGKTTVEQKILPIEELENEVYNEMTEREQQEILRLFERYLTSFREKLKHQEEHGVK